MDRARLAAPAPMVGRGSAISRAVGGRRGTIDQRPTTASMSEGGPGRAPKPRVKMVTRNPRPNETTQPRYDQPLTARTSQPAEDRVAYSDVLLELHELNFRCGMRPGAPYGIRCAKSVQNIKSCNSNRTPLYASPLGAGADHLATSSMMALLIRRAEWTRARSAFPVTRGSRGFGAPAATTRSSGRCIVSLISSSSSQERGPPDAAPSAAARTFAAAYR